MISEIFSLSLSTEGWDDVVTLSGTKIGKKPTPSENFLEFTLAPFCKLVFPARQCRLYKACEPPLNVKVIVLFCFKR